MKMRNLVAFAALVALGTAGCADLDVPNLNDPDRERALARASDVEALIGGSFNAWWFANHDWAPGPALSTMADEHTASWGNFGMQDMSSEPRVALQNDPSYGYAYVFEDPWNASYRALSAIRDGLGAIQDGVVTIPEEARAVAFARLVQGLTHGTLALVYDQAFILDTDTEVETAEMQSYDVVMNYAIQKLDEAIAAAQGQSFSVPSTWLGGFENMDADYLIAVANGFKARYMASVGRTPAERDGADWGAIATAAANGPDEPFGVFSSSFNTPWWDILKSYGGVMPIWARTDYKTVGPADISGNWEAWMALAPADRTEFRITTHDRRVTGSVDDPTSNGLWFRFHGASRFRPERGTYHFSQYGDNRYWDYLNSPFMTGFAEDLTPREMDYLMAEAFLRGEGGTEADAIALINKYRVGNGELPDLTAAGAPGGTSDCVPQMPDGSCADVWESFKYDKRIEVWHTGLGIAFFDDRGWGDLVSGTAIHLPVPASTLLTLLEDIYTFGGDAGGAAPVSADISFDTPQTPEEISERLKAYERWDALTRKSPEEMVGIKH